MPKLVTLSNLSKQALSASKCTPNSPQYKERDSLEVLNPLLSKDVNECSLQKVDVLKQAGFCVVFKAPITHQS